MLCQLGNIVYRTSSTLKCDPKIGHIIGNKEASALWGREYMVVGGAPMPRADHREAVAHLALAMRTAASRMGQELEMPIRFRMGIETGPLVAGVIGEKRLLYDVWGTP